jgi:hypothetical protein
LYGHGTGSTADRGDEHRLHYVYQWFFGAGEEYAEAIEALWTRPLIIDSASTSGGVPHERRQLVVFGTDVDSSCVRPRDRDANRFTICAGSGVGDRIDRRGRSDLLRQAIAC